MLPSPSNVSWPGRNLGARGWRFSNVKSAVSHTDEQRATLSHAKLRSVLSTEVLQSTDSRSPDNPHNTNQQPPKTPNAASPNCAKKRGPRPNLVRSSPAPSHAVKMAKIFHEAAVSLENRGSPLPHASPNIKKSRVPIMQPRMTPFGQSNPEDHYMTPADTTSDVQLSPKWRFSKTHSPHGKYYPYPIPPRNTPVQSPVHGKSSIPVSQSRPEPERRHRQHPSSPKVLYPNLQKQPSLDSSNLDSDCHSTHGVSLVIPIAKTPQDKTRGIGTWLNALLSV